MTLIAFVAGAGVGAYFGPKLRPYVVKAIEAVRNWANF
jgi:hypothetical protein